MTTVVRIVGHDGNSAGDIVLHPSHGAAKAVRATFNPSGRADVERLKTLAAAFIAEAESVAARAVGKPHEAESLAAVALARTNAQQASMWAVFAATAGL